MIDFEKEDFTREQMKYDYVFDTVGKSSFFKCFHLLNRGGIYISSDLGYLGQNIYLPLLTPLLKPLLEFKKTVFPLPIDVNGSLKFIQKLLREGKYKPVIDRMYPFEKIQDAYQYVQTGQKTGNVVIKIRES